MINLKEVFIKGISLKPMKTVNFAISAGYVWGKGWTINDEPFRKEISSVLEKNGWEITFSKPNSGISDIAHRDSEYLYLHPMDVSGYIYPEHFYELKEVLSDNTTFSLDHGNISENDDVYPVDDFDIISIFRKNIDSIDNVILSHFKNKASENDIYDILYRNCKINRTDSRSLSSDDIQNILLEMEFNALFRFGHIKKYSDGLFQTVKKYIPLDEAN